MIKCSSKRAIEARLVNNERIILTNRGFYQHIDTIKVDTNVIAFAAEECKKKLRREEIPFQISIIFDGFTKIRSVFEGQPFHFKHKSVKCYCAKGSFLL
jgi:hypothetical protein